MDKLRFAQAIAKGVTESVLEVLESEEFHNSSDGIIRKAKRKYVEPARQTTHNGYIVKKIIKKVKAGKKIRKHIYKFMKVKLVVNKCLSVNGLIKDKYGKLRKIKTITLGPTDRAWILKSDYKNCKEDLERYNGKINKFKDDRMQPPTFKFGEYKKQSSIFGEGAGMNGYSIHPGVSEDLKSELEGFREALHNKG